MQKSVFSNISKSKQKNSANKQLQTTAERETDRNKELQLSKDIPLACGTPPCKQRGELLVAVIEQLFLLLHFSCPL